MRERRGHDFTSAGRAQSVATSAVIAAHQPATGAATPATSTGSVSRGTVTGSETGTGNVSGRENVTGRGTETVTTSGQSDVVCPPAR